MNKNKTNILIDSYLEWYKSSIKINDLKKADEIITPYTNHINDRIPLFVVWKSDSTLVLSDDGMTLDELDMMGLNYSTPTRTKILNDIVKKYSLNLSDNVLNTEEFKVESFPQKKHDMIQAILSIYDLINLNSPNTKNMFKEDVYEFFFENDFGGSVNPKFTGGTSISYSMDYSLGATRKRPHMMFQFVRNPNFEYIASQKFIYEDLEDEPQFKEGGLKFILVTEKEKISERNHKAAEASKVRLIPFSSKKELLSLK